MAREKKAKNYPIKIALFSGEDKLIVKIAF